MAPPVSKGPLRSVPSPVARIDTQTVREKIMGGRRFEEEVPDRDGARCVCGDGVTARDKVTGLCRPCWRQWRWSSVGEFQYQAK